MTTSKKTARKPIYLQFHLNAIVLTTQVSAESIEEATAQGREMRLSDVIDLNGAGWIDGDVKLTGVYEA